MLEQRATEPAPAGGRRVPGLVDDHHVFFYPQWGLLRADGHPLPGGLAPPRALPASLARLVGSLDAAGLPVPTAARRFRRHRESPGFAGFRRLDLTVDLCTDHAREGFALLSAWEVAARSSGRFAPRYHRAGRPGDTVYTAGVGGYESRCYDKGAESGSADPGRLIRPEAQWRFRGSGSPFAEEAADPQWLRDRFARRFGPSFRGRIVVGNMSELGQKLDAEVRSGNLTAKQARAIAGYIVMEPFGLPGVPPRTRRHLAAEARRFGFHLVDGVLEPIEVDLGAVLQEAEQLDLWDSGAVAAGPLDDEDAGLRARIREQLDAHPTRPARPPASHRITDDRWRDGRGRKTAGPANPAGLPGQLAGRPPQDPRSEATRPPLPEAFRRTD